MLLSNLLIVSEGFNCYKGYICSMYYLYLSSATGDCGIWRDVLGSTIEMRIIFALQKWISCASMDNFV